MNNLDYLKRWLLNVAAGNTLPKVASATDKFVKD